MIYRLHSGAGGREAGAMGTAPASQVVFGELLRRCREGAGLTQEELAERAQMSVRGLVYLERGQRRPHPHTARRLAEALALAPPELATFMRAARPDGPAVAAAPPLVPTAQPQAAALPVPPTPLVGR